MDGIDYTPPTTQEREFLDWAMAKVREKRNADKPAMSDRERMELWRSYLKQDRED